MKNKLKHLRKTDIIIAVIFIVFVILMINNRIQQRKENTEKEYHYVYNCAVDYVVNYYYDNNYCDRTTTFAAVDHIYKYLNPENNNTNNKEMQRDSIKYLEDIKNNHEAIQTGHLDNYAYQNYDFAKSKDNINIFRKTANLLNDKISSFSWYQYEDEFEQDYDTLLDFIVNCNDIDYAFANADDAEDALFHYSMFTELLSDYCRELEKSDYYEEIYNNVK